MSELFVFRCPLHISQFNASHNVLPRTLQDLYVIANNLWLCVKSWAILYWYIFGKKIDGLIVAYRRPVIQLPTQSYRL
jgi:hypothetical protein